MKTIRKNTFETNSSSTHALTVEKKSSKNTEVPLVIDNVLYPKQLMGYCVSFGDSSMTRMETKDQKAAVLFHWHLASNEDVEEDEDNDTEETRLTRSRLTEIIKEKCGYSDIVWKPSNEYDYDYYPSAEYSEDYSDVVQTEENLINFIDDVVLDDEMEIIDSDTAN